jgi:hypothetical protein
VVAIYLFASMILSRKKELLEIPPDEPEMLHYTRECVSRLQAAKILAGGPQRAVPHAGCAHPDQVLLAREPVVAIYLFASMILSRKKELLEIPPDEPEMCQCGCESEEWFNVAKVSS